MTGRCIRQRFRALMGWTETGRLTVHQGQRSGPALDTWLAIHGKAPFFTNRSRTPSACAKAAGMPKRPCAFLDRDGTLNRDTGYTHRPEELAWMPDAREAVRRLNDAGWLVVVVTNQSGIARGYFDEPAMHRFHEAMQAGLAEAGARIDAFYFCPHHVDGVVPDYCNDHPDRKPRPGMLLRAMTDLDIDPARSFMIGDRADDVLAGKAAGLAAHRYDGGSLLTLVETAMASFSA